MGIKHNLGGDVEGEVRLRIAIRRNSLTIKELSELLVKSMRADYEVSRETMQALTKQKLVDSEGNICNGVLNAIVKMYDMATDIPELAEESDE